MSKKKTAIIIVITLAGILFFLSEMGGIPDRFTYGVSFSRFHSDELGLDWKEVYLALLNDLEVKNFRFSAHWLLTEPEDGKYNFEELDFQIKEAKKRGASVILAVGRRLPGWPECHEPRWLNDQQLTINDQRQIKKYKQEKILKYIETTVNRYKDYENIKYWQVENEPFLAFFSRSNCGKLDKDFLREEIKLVKKLDPVHPVMITASGEFDTWFQAYREGDVFGTSQYLYVWWRKPIGPFRYPISPAFFRIKRNLMKILFKDKPAIVIELSAEPWLLQPIIDVPLEIQLQRMGIDKFEEMVKFSSKTSFDTFYFWGAEWWYWLKVRGYDEKIWNRAREIISR